MFHKITKKFFYFLSNFVQGVQVTLVFLAFFVILYWIFQIAGATFFAPVAPFFEGIKDFMHLFYNRTVAIDQVSIDFSFLLAAFLFLIIAQALKLLVESIDYLEKKYDSLHEYVKQSVENTFNKKLEQQYIAQETLNNRFLMIVQFRLKNLAKDKFFDHDVNEGVEEKTKEVLNEFSKIFGKEFVTQRDFTKEGLLLYISYFKDMERIVSEFGECISLLKMKYAEEKWQIDYLSAIDVYAKANEIGGKFNRLVKLINTGVKNKIMCFSTFKQRYLIEKNQIYKIEEYGAYKIEEYEDIYLIEV